VAAAREARHKAVAAAINGPGPSWARARPELPPAAAASRADAVRAAAARGVGAAAAAAAAARRPQSARTRAAVANDKLHPHNKYGGVVANDKLHPHNKYGGVVGNRVRRLTGGNRAGAASSAAAPRVFQAAHAPPPPPPPPPVPVRRVVSPQPRPASAGCAASRPQSACSTAGRREEAKRRAKNAEMSLVMNLPEFHSPQSSPERPSREALLEQRKAHAVSRHQLPLPPPSHAAAAAAAAAMGLGGGEQRAAAASSALERALQEAQQEEPLEAERSDWAAFLQQCADGKSNPRLPVAGAEDDEDSVPSPASVLATPLRLQEEEEEEEEEEQEEEEGHTLAFQPPPRRQMAAPRSSSSVPLNPPPRAAVGACAPTSSVCGVSVTRVSAWSTHGTAAAVEEARAEYVPRAKASRDPTFHFGGGAAAERSQYRPAQPLAVMGAAADCELRLTDDDGSDDDDDDDDDDRGGEALAPPPRPALPEVDTNCTAPALISTVNGNKVRSFSTHGHQSAAKGSSSTVSRSDI
jgi:hypothetical protein